MTRLKFSGKFPPEACNFRAVSPLTLLTATEHQSSSANVNFWHIQSAWSGNSAPSLSPSSRHASGGENDEDHVRNRQAEIPSHHRRRRRSVRPSVRSRCCWLPKTGLGWASLDQLLRSVGSGWRGMGQCFEKDAFQHLYSTYLN